MNQLEYIPGIGGQAIQLDGPVAFVGTADKLRGREWNYDLGYRDLLNANRPARVVDVTLLTDADTANALRRVADADVMAGKPGTFVAQNEWRQRGYILEAEPRVIHYDDLEIGLKVALLDGAWWRMVEKEFLPEETPVTEYASETGEIVTVTGAVETPLHSLKIYGKSVQDGTPTPSSPVLIDVVEGANLLDVFNTFPKTTTTYKGCTMTNNGDGSFTLSGTNSMSSSWSFNSTSGTLVLPAGTYTLTGLNDASNVSIGLNYDGYFHDTSQSSWTFTLSEETTITQWRVLVFASATISGTVVPMLVAGSVGKPPIPYGSIGIDIDDTITPIDLNGNVLASLPDGTCDELTINDSGNVSIEKNVGYIASYNGETVGDNYISTTGELSTGASVYYELTSPTTSSFGSITMPNVEDGSYIKVVAAVTPTITASWALTSEFFLDYPHNYEYDYSKIAAADSIESSVYTPSDVHLVIFGPATNPYILVGGNKYQVNVTVPSGGYVTIDGREKTIVLTLADGTEQNAFSYGVRGGGQGGGTYIFEPIQAGTQEVTYSGTFGFNLGWYEEEGEPPWKSY